MGGLDLAKKHLRSAKPRRWHASEWSLIYVTVQMYFSNGWSIIVGAAAHSLPSSSIANNRCPLERNHHSNHFPRVELKVAGRTAERWACRKQRPLLRIPSRWPFSCPPSSHTALFLMPLIFEGSISSTESWRPEMFEGLVVSENGDAFPILSRRLSETTTMRKPTSQLVAS